MQSTHHYMVDWARHDEHSPCRAISNAHRLLFASAFASC